MTKPRGIDVSNHQKIINWQEVKAAGYEFAFIKATEGTKFIDPYFERNWYEAKNAGLVVGAYHFPLPWENEAREEADFFYSILDRVGGLKETDMHCLDAEVVDNRNFGSYGAWFLYWLQILESYTGYKSVVYTSQYYVQSLSITQPEFREYPLWIANWVLNPKAVGTASTFPRPIGPWDLVAFWQYSASGQVPGINGDCDLDIFNGEMDRLVLYGKPKTEKPSHETDIAAILEQLSLLDKIVVEHRDRIEHLIDEAETITNKIRTLLGK